MSLTARQNDVLRAVRELTARQGFPPSGREIAAETRLSPSRVRQHLDALAARGAIAREPGTARGIRLKP